jgi:hypothetical protein
MTTNQDPLDSALRAAIGLALFASPILGFATGPWNLFGLVLMATGMLGYCPIYAALGRSSCRPGSFLHRTDVVRGSTSHARSRAPESAGKATL